MRVFLTGATGVIGRRAIPRLVAAGHQVTAVGRTAEKQAALERLGARAVPLDLFDADAARRAFQGHDAVVNLATHIPSSPLRMLFRSQWRENDRIRRDASRILAEAARRAGVARFVQESFGLMYPDSGDRWIDELTPLRPSPYNVASVDAEQAAIHFAESGGAGVVLRFAGLYGPDPMTAQLIKVVRRGWSPLPGRPEAYFSSLSQDDAASAVVAALDLPPGIYNVTDDEPLTRRELVDAIAAAVNAAPARFAPPWTARLMGAPGECMSRSERISNRKLRSASGWRPASPSAREGFSAVIDSLRRAGAQSSGSGDKRSPRRAA